MFMSTCGLCTTFMSAKIRRHWTPGADSPMIVSYHVSNDSKTWDFCQSNKGS